MQVTTRGVISLRYLISEYNPRPFPLSTNDRLIAPYWDAPFDGEVLFRLSDNQTLLSEVGSTINDALEFDFTPKKLLIATWMMILNSTGNIVK